MRAHNFAFAVLLTLVTTTAACTQLESESSPTASRQSSVGQSCNATYECPASYSCVSGVCEWVGHPPCNTTCDCPNMTVCREGRCDVAFSPHPMCFCDAHCAAGEVCSSTSGGRCDPVAGGGGGGGGDCGGFGESSCW